jgi:hypothetical protein
VLHQAANYRIGVHVVQFLFHFSRTVDVEVIESLLPEGLPFLPVFVETKCQLSPRPPSKPEDGARTRHPTVGAVALYSRRTRLLCWCCNPETRFFNAPQ